MVQKSESTQQASVPESDYTQQVGAMHEVVGLYVQEFDQVRKMRANESDKAVLPGDDPMYAVLVRLCDLANEIEASYVQLRIGMDQFKGYTEEDHNDRQD